MSFNLIWIAVWVLAVRGLRVNIRPAIFAARFPTIAMVMNGVAHHLLALRARGYFAGLPTSPFEGTVGLLLGNELVRLTRSASAHSMSG